MMKVIQFSNSIILMALVCCGFSASAATVVWDGSASDGNFATAANWNVSGVETLPGESGDASDNTIIQIAQTATVSSVYSSSNELNLILRGGAGLVLNSNASDVIPKLGYMYIGYNGVGTASVSQLDGTVNVSSQIAIGDTGVGGAGGTYTLTSGVLNVAQHMNIGAEGNFVIDGAGGSVNLGVTNPGLGDLNLTGNGQVTFKLGSSSVGTIAAHPGFGEFNIASATSKLVIDVLNYSGGAASIPLVTYSARSGAFDPANISINNLNAGLSAEIVYDTDSMDLVLTSLPYAAERAAIEALGNYTAAPAIYADDQQPGGATTINASDSRKAIYYDALDYEGNSTRVFALIDIPDTATALAPVPAIVLVHGGGGTADAAWLDKWVARGYAAIAIAVEGQTDAKVGGSYGTILSGYNKHAMSGPERDAIYADTNKPIADQWMYHAVADTVLANSLMRSLPEVDASKVGIMGVSWGGVITSTVIGVDDRFAFAIPVYGSGHKYDIPNQYGTALANNQVYRQAWDPILRIDRATMPTMWFSWPQETNFSLDAQAATYFRVGGKYAVSLIPGLGHSIGAASITDDTYEFANSVLTSGGTPWSEQQGLSRIGNAVEVTLRSDKAFASASLIYTTGTGWTGALTWLEVAASNLFDNADGTWTATALLPAGVTGWFINFKSVELGTDGNPLVASSDYQELISLDFLPAAGLAIDHKELTDQSTGRVSVVFSGPTHAEVIEVSVAGESHAGSFSTDVSGPLVYNDPVASGTPLMVSFDNTVAGLSLGQSATATLSLTMENLDGSTEQFTLPLSATVRTARQVIFTSSANWSTEHPFYTIDDVIIRNDAVVILDEDSGIGSVSIGDEASPLAATFTIDQNFDLEVAGSLTLGTDTGAGIVNQLDGSVLAESLVVNLSGSGDTSQYNLSGGLLAVDGFTINTNGRLNISGGSFTPDLTNAVTVNGDLLINGGAFTSNISGLDPSFAGSGSIKVQAGSFHLTAGAGGDLINLSTSLLEVSGGVVDVSGQLLLNSSSEFRVLGDTASIEVERISSGSSGTFAFVFNETGVSTVNVDFFIGLANASIDVDGSSYMGGEDTFTLIDSTNLTALFNLGNLTISGFETQNKHAFLTQDQTDGADWVQLVVENLLANGVPKQWMRDNGLAVTDAATAEDNDQDGKLNWEEFYAGTNPNDATSALKVSSTTLSGDQLRISWQAIAGKTYTLNYKSNLTDLSWTPIETNLSGVTPESEITVMVSGSQGFYQVVVE